MYGNLATDYSGGALRDNISVHNCTLVGNRFSTAAAGHGGGGVCVGNGKSAVVVNSIIYDNQASVASNIYVYGSGALYLTNSCTYTNSADWTNNANWAVGGNITSNPLFAASGSNFGTNHIPGNYRLSAHSPCIGAGMNQPWMLGAVDLEGNPRVDAGTALVVGCYEFAYSHGTLVTIR